jgi:two-component system OmpR family sensor kinase
MNSLRYRLILWLSAGMILCTALGGLATYDRVSRAAGEFFDFQLAAVAANLPARIISQPRPPDDGDPDNDILIEIRDRAGKLIYPVQPDVRLPKVETNGFSTVHLASGGWRIYSVDQGERIVQVAQPMHARSHLVANLLVRTILPFALLIPALAVLIWVTVGRLIGPIRRIATAVGDRSPLALTPLPVEGSPAEIRPLLVALNALLRQLDEALSAQRAFVADAAHELRSPLTALKLQLQLAERAKTEEQRLAAFQKLHQRLDRSSRLVEQLLTLARESPDGEPREFEPTDLGVLAREVASDYSPLASHRHIHFTIAVDDPAPMVLGLRDSLRMMLSNIVDNALRYSPEGGRVVLRATWQGSQPSWSIEDNGPGIPAAERGRVFDRFYRRSGTAASGSGLGLAIVKAVAEQHRCVIDLSDPEAGPGLIISVCFPEQPAELRAAALAAEEPA